MFSTTSANAIDQFEDILFISVIENNGQRAIITDYLDQNEEVRVLFEISRIFFRYR